MIKKSFALVLAMAMVLALAACGAPKSEPDAAASGDGSASVSAEASASVSADDPEPEEEPEQTDLEEETDTSAAVEPAEAPSDEPSEAAESPEKEPQQEETAEYAEYDAIIARYAQAIAEGWDFGTMMDEDLCYMVPDCIKEKGVVGYAMVDFNKDGVKELAIAADADPGKGWFYGMVFDFYTMEENFETGKLEAKRLFCSGERDRWYYYGDGTVLNIGSGGASQSLWHVCTADWEMAYVDCVEYDEEQDANDPWLAFDGETWNHISEDEAEARIEEMESSIKELEVNYIG